MENEIELFNLASFETNENHINNDKEENENEEKESNENDDYEYEKSEEVNYEDNDKNLDNSEEEKNEEDEYENKEIDMEEEEEEEEEKEESKKYIFKNIVIYFEEEIYQNAINKTTEKKSNSCKLDEIKGIFEKEFKNNNNKLKKIDNEYYYLFEITFYCTYLNLIEIYYKIKNNVSNNILSISKLINEYIKAYEKYSLYINFIDKEGIKTYIKNKYDEIFCNFPPHIKFYNAEYKSTSELRRYLLKNKKFNFKNEKNIDIIEKNIKFIKKEEINEIYPPLNEHEIEALNMRINEENTLYIGSKAREVKKFLKKFDYDNSNEKVKNNYFKDYIDSYLSIFEDLNIN